jgi:hypothetical protein
MLQAYNWLDEQQPNYDGIEHPNTDVPDATPHGRTQQ